MASDRLLVLLVILFKCGMAPDELAREWDEMNRPVIRISWLSGHYNDYPYRPDIFEAAMNYFEAQWLNRHDIVAQAAIQQAMYG